MAVVVITGCSTGFGLETALAFARRGDTTIATMRNVAKADALKKRAADEGLDIEIETLDVVDDYSVSSTVGKIVAHHGQIDVLVNNAGVGYTVSIEDEDLDEFRTTMEVNVTAVWHLSKLAGAAMVANGRGSIVNIASMLGLVGSTPIKQAHYTASKGAVINLTREMALQWARKGVRVNALCPGWFPSEMTAAMEGDEASQRFIKANSPMPRMGEAQELDGPFLLLASDAGSFMTGHALVVDGGWLAR
jgi:NAD(P)-dependent dehydrogenase (short-subunit alcohol dehydrogenase family)